MDFCCQNQYHYTQTGRKVKKKNEHTPAIAWASKVLPHPGGPWRRNPLGGVTPSVRNTSGCFMWTSSLQTWSTVSSQPPMSENFTDDWVSSNSSEKKNYQNMICGVNTTSKGFLVAFKSSFPLESQRHDLETGRSLELFFNFSLNWLKFKYAEHSIIYKKNQFCSNQDLSQVFLYYSSVNFSCFSWVLSLFPSHL